MTDQWTQLTLERHERGHDTPNRRFDDECVRLAMIYTRLCVLSDEYMCLAMMYVRIRVFDGPA